MFLRRPRSTRIGPLCPSTPLCRSLRRVVLGHVPDGRRGLTGAAAGAHRGARLMVTGLVFGAVAGLGVFLVVRGLFPAPRSVADDIEVLRRPRWEMTEPGSAQARLNRFAVGLLRAPGTDREPIERDLPRGGETEQRRVGKE